MVLQTSSAVVSVLWMVFLPQMCRFAWTSIRLMETVLGSVIIFMTVCQHSKCRQLHQITAVNTKKLHGWCRECMCSCLQYKIHCNQSFQTVSRNISKCVTLVPNLRMSGRSCCAPLFRLFLPLILLLAPNMCPSFNSCAGESTQGARHGWCESRGKGRKLVLSNDGLCYLHRVSIFWSWFHVTLLLVSRFDPRIFGRGSWLFSSEETGVVYVFGKTQQHLEVLFSCVRRVMIMVRPGSGSLLEL